MIYGLWAFQELFRMESDPKMRFMTLWQSPASPNMRRHFATDSYNLQLEGI
jgi:hypothetical protein